MNTALIDSVFLSETEDEYFYAIWQGDNFVYGVAMITGRCTIR
jgi:hypothetical protein